MSTVIVTGGSRGIGAAIAERAARAGWAVAVNYASDGGAAAEVVSRIEAGGGRAIAVEADISDEDAVAHLFDEAASELGPVEGLVNNAGIMGSRGPVAELDRDLTRRLFDVNILGPFLCCKAAVNAMSRSRGGKGGAIVNISSGAALHGGVGSYIDFATSKAALDRMSTALAQEVGAEGIRVNCVRPGFVLTDGNRAWMEDHPDWADSVLARTPMGRGGACEEIAEAALWLLSDEASYVAGAVLDVSGGFAVP